MFPEPVPVPTSSAVYIDLD